MQESIEEMAGNLSSLIEITKNAPNYKRELLEYLFNLRPREENRLIEMAGYGSDPLPFGILIKLCDPLEKSDYLVEEMVEKMEKAKCSLDRVVLLKDARVTQKILEHNQSIVGAPNALNYVMTELDLENLEVLIHSGSYTKQLQIQFSNELKNMMLCLLDLEKPKIFLKKLITWKLENADMLTDFSKVFQNGTKKAVQLLLDYEFDKYAKKNGSCEFLLYLFANPNVEAEDIVQKRSFNVNAIHCNNTALALSVKYRSKTSVKFLLDIGANPNLPKERNSPLGFAFKIGSKSKIELLLNAGADPNGRDDTGASPLHWTQDVDMIHRLLFLGADIDAIDNQQRCVFENKSELLQYSPMLAHFSLVRMQRVLMPVSIVNYVKSKPEFKVLSERYLNQVKWMKKQVVYGTTTMLAVITGKIRKVPRGTNIDEIVLKIFEDARGRQLDSYYVTLLRHKLNDMISMIELKNKATSMLSEFMIMFDPDNIVIDKIMGYLSNNDLLSLARCKK